MNRGPPPTPALEHLVCDLVARGASLAWIAERVGIPATTLRDWAQGDLAHPRYRQFAESVHAAKREHEAELEELFEELLATGVGSRLSA